MLVVADTSPLNYLVWIDAVDILPQLYGQVIIPSEVRAELLAADAPAVVQSWACNIPSWVEVCASDPVSRDDPRWHGLDLGERAALALAAARRPSIILMDERTGTEIARDQGFLVTGTLGVLDEAAHRKLISLPNAIERLKRTSFRYPKAVVDRLLEEAARRRSG
jgi:predicted nucleic acid-binding protein